MDREWLYEKTVGRMRQFGFASALKQIFSIPFRWIYGQNTMLIFAVDANPAQTTYPHDDVILLSKNIFASKKEVWNLPPRHVDTIQRCLDFGCQGFMVEEDGHLAAYGFVQEEGAYHYDRDGRFMIPQGCVVMRNLFVFRWFRGQGLASKIDAARLAHYGQKRAVIAFVRAENRYAIRGWMQLGTRPVIKVVRKVWIGRQETLKILKVENTELSTRIEQGLITCRTQRARSQ